MHTDWSGRAGRPGHVKCQWDSVQQHRDPTPLWINMLLAWHLSDCQRFLEKKCSDPVEANGQSKVHTQSWHPTRCFYLVKERMRASLPDRSTSAVMMLRTALMCVHSQILMKELIAGRGWAPLYGYVHQNQQICCVCSHNIDPTNIILIQPV